MTDTATTHSHRGWTIVKHDTGGRRMGRVVTYTGSKGETVRTDFTLRGLKATIDILEDMTPEQEAHAARIAAMLRA